MYYMGEQQRRNHLRRKRGASRAGITIKPGQIFFVFFFFTKMNQARVVLTLITHIHLFEIAMFIILPFGRKYGGRNLYYYRL